MSDEVGRDEKGRFLDGHIDITATHVMIPVTVQEYQALYGETPEGFHETGDTRYIGLLATARDLRRGEKRWRTLGEPDPLEHEDIPWAITNLLEALARESTQLKQVSDGLDQMCADNMKLESRIEELEVADRKKNETISELNRSKSLMDSRIKAKENTIEEKKGKILQLQLWNKAEQTKINAYQRAINRRNPLQKFICMLFRI